MLISVEGIDGNGKTSVIKRIEQHLHQQGHWPLVVSDWHGPGGELLKASLVDCRVPEAQLAIINCARCLTMQHVTRPALAAGRIVIYDRYLHSTLAYQGAQGLPLQKIRSQHAALGLPMPHATLLLWISPAVARQRMERRGKLDAIDSRGDDFFCRVNDLFLSCLINEPGVHEIDAEQDLDAVAADAIVAVMTEIEGRAPLVLSSADVRHIDDMERRLAEGRDALDEGVLIHDSDR